ncbi:hypothetical protein FNV43_RR13839 [Rhamnella rubrinervis]|uniref:C2H2-type domain-containing protein n=1 Tax=Rhamnella rubrinervis TaxID=2594499 RepID=A0A8K0H1W6_9ROSA|nr:hypothetical protein FNV43_RR13839 [Rhamnella rubrinervis]
MAGRGELGFLRSNALAFPKNSASSLKEQAARIILRRVRSQGHTYVELREERKKFIFFCTLCLSPCYSDSVLFDHLKGNLHNERLSTAKVTLLGPNPWPFNDGVLFFSNSAGNDKQTVTSNGDQCRFLELGNNYNNLAIVRYGENLKPSDNGHLEVDELGYTEDLDSAGFGSDGNFSSPTENITGNGQTGAVLIPGVRVRDEISTIEVREVGYGQIAARFCEKDDVANEISRIWCEWLGKIDFDNRDIFKVPEHDFAVITFSYDVNLGRKGFLDDVKSLLCHSPSTELESGEGSQATTSKRKKSFSDPEDISGYLRNQYDSCGEDSSASSGATSRLRFDQCDNQLLHTRFITNKAIRRELRRKQRIAAEIMCDICQHKMLPGKDVATLMNVKTGRLACSSRNVNGAFHVFHTSCLIHWILLCEIEIISNKSDAPIVRQRTRRKTAAKRNEVQKDGEMKALRTPICSVICPECQGTGRIVGGDELEEPTVPLSKMFKYKIKVSDARRAWMKNPEALQNCSIGFHFPSQSEEKNQENVKPLKLLRFYGADPQ